MRTTINLDPDVLAAVDRLSQREGLGRSEAVNALLRHGVLAAERAAPQPAPGFGTFAGGAPAMDLDNIGEVIEAMERDPR